MVLDRDVLAGALNATATATSTRRAGSTSFEAPEPAPAQSSASDAHAPNSSGGQKSARPRPVDAEALAALMAVLDDDDFDMDAFQAALDSAAPSQPQQQPQQQQQWVRGSEGTSASSDAGGQSPPPVPSREHRNAMPARPTHAPPQPLLGTQRSGSLSDAGGARSPLATTSTAAASPATATPATTTSSGKTYAKYLEEASKEDFRDLDEQQFLYESGFDSEGRTVVVVVGCNLPARAVSLERLFLYCIRTLDAVVERDYVLVYLAANQSAANRPSFKWMRRVYSVFNRKYKKNLKRLYIIKPSHWIKLVLSCFRPFVSSKFWAKVVLLGAVNDVYAHISPTQLRFPARVVEALAQSRPLFGVPLAEALETPSHVQNGLPIVVAQCLRFLYEHGLGVEGIFRVPGDRALLNELRTAYDAGERVDLAVVRDPHAVASLLKMYLRDLPEPLIPEALYDPLLATQTDPALAPAAAHARIRALLAALPAPNTHVLQHVLAFAAELARHSRTNKMSVENVSLCFGPTLMWRSTAPDPLAMLHELASVNSLIRTLIEHRELLPAAQPLPAPPAEPAPRHTPPPRPPPGPPPHPPVQPRRPAPPPPTSQHQPTLPPKASS